MAGELKDVWSAVQNFRDKEKAGASDIVVYTEFGPDSAPELMVKSFHRNESNSEKPVKSETFDARKLDQYSESQFCTSNGEHEAESEKFDDGSLPEKVIDDSDTPIEIDKLTLDDKVSSKNHENLHSSNDASEKNVKIQNQKNKESQGHNFFPKFLSSSKEKEAKDKEKDKDKEKPQEEPEPKAKTKKSLNFFRRNKSSNSPTHSFKNNDQLEH